MYIIGSSDLRKQYFLSPCEEQGLVMGAAAFVLGSASRFARYLGVNANAHVSASTHRMVWTERMCVFHLFAFWFLRSHAMHRCVALWFGRACLA